MARGEEGLQVLRDHGVEHRLAGIPGCVGGNRWCHNSPHGQQGNDGDARSCLSIYYSNVQYTSKKLTREGGENMRDTSPCRAAAVAKSTFGIPIHTNHEKLSDRRLRTLPIQSVHRTPPSALAPRVGWCGDHSAVWQG